MPDLDAVRGRIRKSMSQQGIPVMEPDAVVMYYPVRGPDLDDLLAALATAEENITGLNSAIDDLGEDNLRLQARADAAEQERDGMRADAFRAYRKAKGKACGLDLDERCYLCEREFNALVPLRAALARAEGENATRTGDPRPEGSGEG